jgi:hypothetical protein
MSYKGIFTQKVRPIEIEDEGEVHTFYVRKMTGGEMIRRSDEQKKRDPTNEQTNRELIQRCIVNEDGSKITDEDVEGILAMESSAFHKLVTAIVTAMGVKAGADEKKG